VVVEPPAWQQIVPGGSRRMSRQGAAAWRDGDLDTAARAFAGAAVLDPDNPERLFDLGTALGAEGRVDAALPLLERADAAGVANAAYNSGTAALDASQPEAAVRWLREAVLRDPDDADAKRNYELALAMLQQQQQQQQQKQDEDQDEQQDEQEEQQPQPQPGAEPTPTPTPNPAENEALFQALERAEAEAREAMQSPTPQAGQVEKDW
ncbi:MAG: hypothetical protein PVG53_08420, partial [Holophagae bacterium]